jgi:plastocyanin
MRTTLFVRQAPAAFVGLLACGIPTAHAAGTVTGTITVNGTPAPTEVVQVTTNPDVCGTEYRPIEFVGAGGSLKYAVVRIMGAVGDVPVPDTPHELDQNGCRFAPHIVIVGVGQRLNVLNSDGILHNIHTYSDKNAPKNTGQPGFLKSIPMSFTHPEIIRVNCDVHQWMTGRIVVTDTPFIAVTDEDGAFSIPNVPAGAYQVSIWHEEYGETIVDVTVTDGQDTRVTAQLTSR